MRVTGDSLRLSNPVRRHSPFYSQYGRLVNIGAPGRTSNGRSKEEENGEPYLGQRQRPRTFCPVSICTANGSSSRVSRPGSGWRRARSLAAHGAQVVGAARDLTKAEAATMQVRKDAAANGGSFGLVELDLASLKSVRACADKLLAKGEPFDVVIANAGVMATPFGHTADGFETQFGTNHLGHFVFVNRIASLIRTGGRLINLSSSGHRYSNVDLQDPNFERTPYEPFVAYGRSKTANILFAVAFDRRHRKRGVRAAAVHPGAIQTESRIQAIMDQMNQQLATEGKAPFQWKTIPQGAATSVWASVVAPADEIGGRYCENCHVGNVVPDDVTISAISEGVRGYALDPKNAEALWKKSEELVGESF